MGKAISHVQGKGSISHNNREFSSANVDRSRTKDNVIFVNESIADAYHKLFDSAVAEFNAKQKRSDRKKNDSYFVDLFNREPCQTVVTATNKEKSFYEDVVQIGKMEDTAVGTADAEVAKECLIEYMNGFQKRNPQFYVFNAVLHMDEATPHLHIDYIPVAKGYKTGLSVRNGLAKALEQMGYGKNKDNISKWRDAERKVFRDICVSKGIEVSQEIKGEGREYIPIPEYKEIKKKVNEVENELQQKQDTLDDINSRIESEQEKEKKYQDIEIRYNELTQKAQKKVSSMPFSKKQTTYTFSENDYNQISKQLKAAMYIQNKEKELQQKEKSFNEMAEERSEIAHQREREINARENELNSKEMLLMRREYELDEERKKIEKIKEESKKAYQRNKDAVELLAESEKENERLKEKISDLKLENKVISEIRADEYTGMTGLANRIYNEDMKTINNLKKEIQTLKSKLYSAVEFIKNACQSINMMLDRKGNEYTLSQSASEQRTLLKVVKEYGTTLLQSMGFGKSKEEAENIVKLPDVIEQAIEEENDKVHSIGAMHL